MAKYYTYAGSHRPRCISVAVIEGGRTKFCQRSSRHMGVALAEEHFSTEENSLFPTSPTDTLITGVWRCLNGDERLLSGGKRTSAVMIF